MSTDKLLKVPNRLVPLKMSCIPHKIVLRWNIQEQFIFHIAQTFIISETAAYNGTNIMILTLICIQPRHCMTITFFHGMIKWTARTLSAIYERNNRKFALELHENMQMYTRDHGAMNPFSTNTSSASLHLFAKILKTFLLSWMFEKKNVEIPLISIYSIEVGKEKQKLENLRVGQVNGKRE